MKTCLRSRYLILLSLLGIYQNAYATTNCSANASDLVFGDVSMGLVKTSSATVDIECNTFDLSLLATARVRMCLNIGAGTASGSTVSTRMMNTGSLDLLEFQIYRDPALTQIWGDTNASNLNTDLEYAVPLLGGSGTTSMAMYGRVPSQLSLAADSYQNTFIGTHTRLDYRYSEILLGAPSWPTSCTSGGNGGGSITFPFSATATVPASCTIEIVNDLNFGSVPGLINSHQDQTTDLSFICTKNTPWKVSLDNGLHYSTGRRMQLGTTGQYVGYELYRDSGRTLRWGNTLDVDTMNSTGTGSSQSLTIYGRVPAPQSVASGHYSDTVTVTITY